MTAASILIAFSVSIQVLIVKSKRESRQSRCWSYSSIESWSEPNVGKRYWLIDSRSSRSCFRFFAACVIQLLIMSRRFLSRSVILSVSCSREITGSGIVAATLQYSETVLRNSSLSRTRSTSASKSSSEFVFPSKISPSLPSLVVSV